MNEPTAEDRRLDLVAALAACDDVPQCWYTLLDIQESQRDEFRDEWLLTVQLACPAAIRRALAAEAEVAERTRQRDLLARLHDELKAAGRQEIDRLKQALRDLLLSADASWETARGAGHDWAEAVAAAREVLLTK